MSNDAQHQKHGSVIRCRASFFRIGLKSTRLGFFLAMICTICACQKANHNQVELIDGTHLLLQEKEVLKTPDPLVGEQYTRLFNAGPIQIPLFKYLKHPDYELFVGLPIDSSIPEIWQRDSSLTDVTDSLFYRCYSIENLNIAEYASKTPQGTLLFIAYVSSSLPLSDPLFSLEMMSERLMKP